MSETVTASLRATAKGTALVFTGMLVSHSLLFATRLVIVRSMSKEDLGVYTLAVGIVSILSMLASAGLWEGATRYISVFAGEGRRNDAEAVRRSSLKIGAVTGGVICVATLLLSGVLSRYVFYKPEISVPLMVISFFIPANVMTLILASGLRGYGIIRPNVYFMDIGQPLLFLLLLTVVLLFNLSFIGVICAYVLSMAASCVVLAHFGCRKSGMRPFAFRGEGGYVMELLRFSVPILSIDFMYLLFRWTDTLMLGRYGTSEQVGVYSVSVSLAALLILPLGALWYVYLPIAGDLHAKRQSGELTRTYQVLTKWVFAATLPVFFILFFFPEMTITFLFGERYRDAALPLRILCIGYLFTAFMGTNSMLLLVFGLSKTVMRVSAAGAVLNILLNYVLVKHLGLGMKGSALSTMVSLIVVGLGYSFVLYRHRGIHPVSSGYLKPVIGSAMIGAVIYAAAKSLPLFFWMLPVYFLLYICGYVASLVLTRSVDNEDVFFFGKILKKAGVGPETTRKIIGTISRGNGEKIDVC